MKRLIYSCIAVCALIFTSCADQDVTENINGGESKPGVTVSMSLEGNMQGNQAAPASRANTNIGYKTDDATGFPTPVGLFDAVGNDGKEIAEGTKVPVVLIFRSTDNSQPITKVETKWTYHKGGNLTLEPSETFDMGDGTDLTKGKWYVCGILDGEFLKVLNQVKINPFSEGHVAKVNGQEVTWGANIPYIFGWRELVAKSKTTFKAKDNKPVRFKQFGTIVRLKVTNKTGFNFKYNGVRIITSNILCGQFDLKAFDDKDLVPNTSLHDTQDTEISDPTTNVYQNVFAPFKFYQRPMTDNTIKDNGLYKTRRYRLKGEYIANYAEEKENKDKADNDLSKKLNTALTYYDHTFLKNEWGNNFDNVPNNSEAPSYIYVWMAPQEQAVKYYDGDEEGMGNVTVKRAAKTQFLLMAVPTETSTSTPVIPTSINMIPAYGTRVSYTSGVNYSARGSVVFKFPPLSYIAKHDNFGTESELSNEGNQEITNTVRYTYDQVEAKSSSLASIGYMVAGNEYWRSIIAQGYAFAGLGKKYNATAKDYIDDYTSAVSVVSPAKLPNWNSTRLVFQTYSKGVKNESGKTIGYMIGLSKKPDYISGASEGRTYRGRTSKSYNRVASGYNENFAWIDNNNYRYTIRYENMSNNTAVLKQRYLGPRFVLDMEDIDNDDFWADPSNGTTYPNDVTRIIPLPGVYLFADAEVKNGGGTQRFWFIDDNSVGKSAQYWTLDDAPAGGRYAQEFRNDNNGKAPKLSVGFGVPGLSGGMGGFFYYLYKGTPLYQDRVANFVTPDSRYEQNLIMKAPVRLWRKSIPYAD